jgi:hypothetical protein
MDSNFTHVLIIGNGFDLDQQLPTSYSNFIQSDYFQSIPDNLFKTHLLERSQIKNWSGIENELTSFSQIVEKNKDETNNFKEYFKLVTDALKAYLKTINIDLNKNSNSYKLIQGIVNENYLIIDFNYTETTREILKELGQDEDTIAKRLIKIHGDLKSDIIFGIEDTAKIDAQHIYLLKSTSMLYSKNNISEFLKKAENIYFFGHSLGNTDHSHFNGFFYDVALFPRGKIIKLYYYKDDGTDDLYRQLHILTKRKIDQLKINNTFIPLDTDKINN